MKPETDSCMRKVDKKADERIRGALWSIRSKMRSQSRVKREALRLLLQDFVDSETEEYHKKLAAEWAQPLNDGLSTNELIENSPALLEAYKQRREAEALLLVLTRELEQRPPRNLKGAKPC